MVIFYAARGKIRKPRAFESKTLARREGLNKFVHPFRQGDVMSDATVGNSAAAVTPASTEQSFWKRPLGPIATVVVSVVALGLLLLMKGGQPYSKLFYLLMALIFGRNLYYSFQDQTPWRIAPKSPPASKGIAITEAVFHGITSAAFFFTLFLTLSFEWKQWPTAVFVGLMTGIEQYRFQRGKPRSWRLYVWLLLVFLALLFVLFVIKKFR